LSPAKQPTIENKTVRIGNTPADGIRGKKCKVSRDKEENAEKVEEKKEKSLNIPVPYAKADKI
jgi:hypothetical protein